MYGVDRNDKAGSMNALKDSGFSGIVTGHDPETANIAADLGIDAYYCQGAYPVPATKDIDLYLSEDINGKKQIWFNSTCPNNELVRTKTLEDTQKWSEDINIKGIFIDGARFSSPCSGKDIDSFFTCFCADCKKKAISFGFDPKKMKHDVKNLYVSLKNGADHPYKLFLQRGVKDWFLFRKHCTTEFLSKFSRIVRSNNKAAAIFIFSPSISDMVGQNYIELLPYFDIISPMIYRAYKDTPGPACLNRELAAMARLIKPLAGPDDKAALKLISSLTGIPLDGYDNIDMIDKGLDISVIGHEVKKSVNITGNITKLVPIIQLDDDKLFSAMKEAETGGVNNIMFFLYNKEYLTKIYPANH